MPTEMAETVVPMLEFHPHWRAVFDKYDLDKDGRVTIQELKAAIRSEHYTKDLPDKFVENIMKSSDRDNSGYLDYAEFIDMVQNPAFKAVFGNYVIKYVHSIIPKRGRSYEQEYSCWPPAVCMILISLVELIQYCYDAANGYIEADGDIAQLFIYHPHKRKEIWRFITYMLVHTGVVHLLYNILVQIMLGIPLEMVHRWKRVAVVYLAGVAAGSLANSLTEPQSALAGSSGGVFALLTAHIATVIMNWSEMKYNVIILISSVSLVTIAVLFCEFSVAHVAGGLTGLLVGVSVLRNLEEKKWEIRLKWVSVSVFITLMVAGILANIFWTSHFPQVPN